MSKRKANNKTGVNVVTKKKCSLKFKPEWLIEVAETELPISCRKQLTKLGDIFTCREGNDDVVCQICQVACSGDAFATGKRRYDWKIDYLRRRINRKIHLDSVTKLQCQKSGGLQRLL